MRNINARVEIHADHGIPCRMYDFQGGSNSEALEDTAEAMLKKIAPLIQINPDLSQIKFDRVKKSLTGSHVLYQQQFYGKPVSGAWIRVDIDNDGKVFNIMNDLAPENRLKRKDATDEPKISVDEAKSLLCGSIKSSEKTVFDFGESELVYFIHKDVPVLAWKLLLKASNPCGEWKVYVDAKTGTILEKFNLLRYVDGEGAVFDPSPVATLNDFTLRDDSAIPANAYSVIALKELEDTGMLDGPFVSTVITGNRAVQPNFKFLFTRADRRFKEVMAYYHIDSVQRYIQQLGFDNVMNKRVQVNIDGSRSDNSFYSSIKKSITFGTGGVDDAEDAEIIVHEYGHAILDDVVPGFGENNDQAKAMGEGFGDYLAASFFADKKPDELKPTFASWNAVALNGPHNPPSMRRLDGVKKFPANFILSAHADGEIWSACLWSIRNKLGRTPADKLIIEHLHLLTRNSTFETAANAMLMADKIINNGVNAGFLREVFVANGVLV